MARKKRSALRNTATHSLAAASLGLWSTMLVATACPSAACFAQSSNSAQGSFRDAAVQPATAGPAPRTTSREARNFVSSVRFAQRPTAVGDRVVQTLHVEMELTTRIVQSGQTAHEGAEKMLRQQRRSVEVTGVRQGRLHTAKVNFAVARNRLAGAAEDDSPQPQPVEGKQYIVQREGDKLLVTDPHGEIPPQDQFEIVAESLSSLGKPSPLAKLLAGRTIAVGEKLLVPREIAAEMLGLSSEMGEIRRFELTLLRVAPASDAPSETIADFLAKIETVARTSSRLTATIAGRLRIEASSCRTVSAQLAGPVNMTSIERTPLGIYQYNAHGGIRVSVESEYSAPQAQ